VTLGLNEFRVQGADSSIEAATVSINELRLRGIWRFLAVSRAPEVHHPALKLVKHAEDAAFVIASISESMGAAADCGRRRPDGDPDFSAAPATGYGTYYAAGFNFSNGNVDPATLWTVWSNVNGSWKVVSYALLSP
jgi:hypothetical protein